MIEVQTSAVINRPIDQVFEYVSQIENCLEWVPGLVMARQVNDGPIGIGTVGVETFQAPFGRLDIEWEITDYQPNKVCTFEAETFLAQSKVTFRLQPVEAGTRLMYLHESQPRGIFKLIPKRLMVQFITKNRKRLLAKIKQILEGRGS